MCLLSVTKGQPIFRVSDIAAFHSKPDQFYHCAAGQMAK